MIATVIWTWLPYLVLGVEAMPMTTHVQFVIFIIQVFVFMFDHARGHLLTTAATWQPDIDILCGFCMQRTSISDKVTLLILF